MKSTWYKKYDYGKTKNLKKTRYRRSANDHGGFQQQSTQRSLNKYDHMNSQNER